MGQYTPNRNLWSLNKNPPVIGTAEESFAAVQASDVVGADATGEEARDVVGADATGEEEGDDTGAAEALDATRDTTVSFDTAFEMLRKRAREVSESEDDVDDAVVAQLDGVNDVTSFLVAPSDQIPCLDKKKRK